MMTLQFLLEDNRIVVLCKDNLVAESKLSRNNNSQKGKRD